MTHGIWADFLADHIQWPLLYMAAHCFLCHGEPEAGAWGAQGKPSPGSLITLPRGNPREVDITLCKWGALCTGDKHLECRPGLWLHWLLWQHHQHEVQAWANAEQRLQELEAQLGQAQKEWTSCTPSSPFRNVFFKVLHSHQHSRNIDPAMVRSHPTAGIHRHPPSSVTKAPRAGKALLKAHSLPNPLYLCLFFSFMFCLSCLDNKTQRVYYSYVCSMPTTL